MGIPVSDRGRHIHQRSYQRARRILSYPSTTNLRIFSDSHVSESRSVHPRTWTPQGPWLGRIVPLESRYEAYRTRRTLSFSGYTNSWSRRSCSRKPARREAAERNTSRCPLRRSPVQSVGPKRVGVIQPARRSRKAEDSTP